MTDSQKLLELAEQNNGIITTAMVVEAGISRGTLKYLFSHGFSCNLYGKNDFKFVLYRPQLWLRRK